MALPQTAAGIGAVGIDPAPDDLAGITTVDGIFQWLGTEEATRNAFKAAMGGTGIQIRDLVYVNKAVWDTAVSGIKVPVTDAAARDLLPVEVGHMAQARRIARLRCGLCAVEEILLQTAAQGGGGMAQASGSLAVLGATQGAGPPTSDPKLKLSVILDPTMDAELVRLSQVQVRKLFNDYAALRGAEPTEEVEPTVEQISAVAQVVAADLVPYADFSILGPYGRRSVGKLCYQAWNFQPDGTWHRREFPGPPSFEHWWASFRVLRTIFLLLDIAPPELLDNYGEMVRGFHTTYGTQAWFLIYTADVRMRSEHFSRLRRYAERDHDMANNLGAGLVSTYNPSKPWYAAFRAAIADKMWWDDNLHRPTMLYLTRVKSASESVHDGTVQSSNAPGHEPARQRSRSRGQGQSHQQKRQRKRRPNRGGGDGGASAHGGGNGRASGSDGGICAAYNSSSGCHRQNCTDNCNQCSYCKKMGHPATKCRINPANQGGSGASYPPPHQGGGRGGGSGKGGGKSGGKGGKGGRG